MGLIAIVIFPLMLSSCIIIPTETAKILAIIVVPSYSHQIPFRPLWTSLSKRGHQVVLLTTNPINDPSLTNLTEIDFHFHYELIKKLDFVKTMEGPWENVLRQHLWLVCHKMVENIYEHPEVRKMYAPNSSQTFDLVIVETLKSPGIYALAHRFNAPLIGASSLGIYNNNHYLIGAPVLPSHPSSWEMGSSAGFNLPLWQRTKNFIRQWYHIYTVLNHFYPEQQMIAEKYLGKDIPDISDMERNISIILYNQQEAIAFPRPRTPNIISFGNLHISKKSAALPKDLKEFLTDLPNGFIYVSLGTNVRFTSFSKATQSIFYDVFANLPCKVVWKFDADLPNKHSRTIYIAKWFQQQSILAHPKIRLFIYQGGTQSTEEAVYYAVPLVGIPIMADQYNQVNKMVRLGVAKYINIKDISKEALNASVIDVLNDKRYKERMLEVKALNEDKPYNTLENVIWWIEFVIRHKGAAHLRTSIANDPWYQKYDVDIIVILTIVTFVILLCVLAIIYKFLKLIINLSEKMRMDIEKKIN